MSINLLHGDCLEEMAKMEAGSIDLTITSPPYDNLRTYEGSLQWNEGIWKQVLEGLFRVTKKGGVVVWIVGDATIKGSETGTSFKQALYAMECGFNLHDTMIYEKQNYLPRNHKRYEQSFEYMFIFTNGPPVTFNPKLTLVLYPRNRSIRFREKEGHKETRQDSKKYRIVSNIFKYKTGGGHVSTDQLAHKHPAIFPEQLAHDHIISWSNEGDTVFDPFMGSGTTGKMAKQLNRNFIGIEKVEKYYKIAKARIHSHNSLEQSLNDGEDYV